MSYEGGVMPSDVTLDVTLQRVTTAAGEGALGACRMPDGHTPGRCTRVT